MNKKKILITGGQGRFANILKQSKLKLNLIFSSKKQLNILDIKSIERYIKKHRPKYLIHCAALSRPMKIHDADISKSIDLNIIGTANVVKICNQFNIKLIYFSTGYVYPGIKGNYKETDSLLPINNYAWSKLGGECAVQMYKNSLILRVCMTEKPFVHNKAFVDFITNFIFHEDIAKCLFKLIKKKGIINVGGKAQSVYNFAKKYNPKIKKIYEKKTMRTKHPLNTSINIKKLKSIIK